MCVHTFGFSLVPGKSGKHRTKMQQLGLLPRFSLNLKPQASLRNLQPISSTSLLRPRVGEDRAGTCGDGPQLLVPPFARHGA